MGLTIGFSYDAKDDYVLAENDNPDRFAEFDKGETINSVVGALESVGHKVIRIGNAKNMINRLVKGDRFDIVFNITEGLNGRGRESLAPAVLELFEQPYVGSDPVTMGITLDKTLAKKLVAYHGITTPGFFTVEKNQTINNFYNRYI